MRTNVFAWTEQHQDYPAFISLNREEDQSYTLTVRSRGNGGRDIVTIAVAPEDLLTMASSIVFGLQIER